MAPPEGGASADAAFVSPPPRAGIGSPEQQQYQRPVAAALESLGTMLNVRQPWLEAPTRTPPRNLGVHAPPIDIPERARRALPFTSAAPVADGPDRLPADLGAQAGCCSAAGSTVATAPAVSGGQARIAASGDPRPPSPKVKGLVKGLVSWMGRGAPAPAQEKPLTSWRLVGGQAGGATLEEAAAPAGSGGAPIVGAAAMDSRRPGMPPQAQPDHGDVVDLSEVALPGEEASLSFPFAQQILGMLSGAPAPAASAAAPAAPADLETPSSTNSSITYLALAAEGAVKTPTIDEARRRGLVGGAPASGEADAEAYRA